MTGEVFGLQFKQFIGLALSINTGTPELKTAYLSSLNSMGCFMELETVKLIQTGVALLTYFVVRWVIGRFTLRSLKRHNFTVQRRRLTGRVINLIVLAVLGAGVVGIWGFEGSDIWVFLTTILTIIGVGLFAQWSILSNLTASLVLYFYHPLKLGDHIEILDKDVPMEGVVEDISFFFLHMIKDGQRYTIPNTLVLQKILTIVEKPSEPVTEETLDAFEGEQPISD